MTIHRVTDIPPSEVAAVIADFEFEGFSVKKIKQSDGNYTLEARKPQATSKAKPKPGSTTVPVPNTSGGAAILAIAKRHVDRNQKYGPHPPDYSDPDWKGEFDCAEFASYCAYRAYGILFATRPKGQVKNAESYTGYWKEDVAANNAAIPWQEALGTPGAFVLRYPPGPGLMGHIGICLGDGDAIYEAHSTARGVIRGTASGRRWDIGVRLPGVAYDGLAVPMDNLLVYRLFDPPRAYDVVVERLQEALRAKGFLAEGDINGIYDRATYDAVVAFQEGQGLLADGEVGRDTGSLLLGTEPWAAIKSQAGAVAGPPTANHDVLTLARTIFGEARGEPAPDGQEAVADVVLNRARSPRYPNNIAEVCLQPFQFSCWNTNDPNYPKIRSLQRGSSPEFDRCYASGERVIKGEVADRTGGALHYHSTGIPTPKWVTNSPKAQVTAKIGTHVFYTGIK